MVNGGHFVSASFFLLNRLMLEADYFGFRVNTMPTDALAPKVASASAGIAMSVKDRQHVLLPQSWFHLLGPNQTLNTIQNVNISFINFEQFSMIK